MLQIITGKFFRKEERYKHDCKSVFFSNYCWIKPIPTCIGTLEPIDHGAITTWIFSYVNQIEKEEKSCIVKIGDDEIVEQFRLLLIFGFRAYFSSQRRDVEHYCRQTKTDITDESVPSQMIPRYFSSEIRGELSESENFIKLIEKALSLKREYYLVTISALRTFCSALEAMDSNVDLAYSMLVYVLESLAQNYDGYTPVWEDYTELIRKPLDSLLKTVPDGTAAGIRETLLRDANLKSQVRFVNFTAKYIETTYFTNEAEGIKFAIQECEFLRALKNAYKMRSGYVHELKPILLQMRVPLISQCDIFKWDKEPYFTLSGLVRLTSHVLKNFITRGESVDTEAIDWSNQLPGIILMQMSPKYWIHNAQSFTPKDAKIRYSSFLEVFMNEQEVVYMPAIMEKIEQLMARATDQQKIDMICLYWIYNYLACSLGASRPNWQRLIEQYKSFLDVRCIETFAVRLIVDKLDWNFNECNSCYEQYNKTRFNKEGMHLPSKLENITLASIANVALKEGNKDMHSAYLNKAILNSAGLIEIQKLFNDALEKNTIVSTQELLFGKQKITS